FFNHDNYLYFLDKVRKYIQPYCDILSYCLMPNHFHLLIHANDATMQMKRIGNNDQHILSDGFKHLLGSYAKAINKQNATTGSLFQQNTHSKCLREGNASYGTTCFHYIHQNPLRAGLITKLEDWDYSSFKDYIGARNGTLCNKQLAFELMDLSPKTFYLDSYSVIESEDVGHL